MMGWGWTIGDAEFEEIRRKTDSTPRMLTRTLMLPNFGHFFQNNKNIGPPEAPTKLSGLSFNHWSASQPSMTSRPMWHPDDWSAEVASELLSVRRQQPRNMLPMFSLFLIHRHFTPLLPYNCSGLFVVSAAPYSNRNPVTFGTSTTQ